MTTIPNIVFTGPAGAGKSTCARLLTERFDLGYETISFATPLKVMLDTQTDRQRLQEFGTDIVRRYEPDAWVRLFLWHLKLRSENRKLYRDGWLPSGDADRWTCDDCRFPNELQVLRDHGWVHVKVDAPRQTRIDRLRGVGKLIDEAQLEHASEHALDGMEPDYTIVNDGLSVVALVDVLSRALEALQR